MKEFEVTVRVRNNRLKERREALGMTQPQFAAAAQVSLTAYRELEALRRSPLLQGDRCWRWRDIALQLARFHCVEPEELFPRAVLAVQVPVASRRVNGDDLFPLLSAHQERLLEGPEAEHDRADLHDAVKRALGRLPPRDARVLCLRFGLEDGEERTREEVGVVLDVTQERIRQIEARAMRRLRKAAPATGIGDFAPCRGEG